MDASVYCAAAIVKITAKNTQSCVDEGNMVKTRHNSDNATGTLFLLCWAFTNTHAGELCS